MSDSSLNEAIPTFLLKTYQILENPKYSDIISWTKNGEGFIIRKVKDFSESVLPLHFRHSNYTSFVRQLNMYDFHKTRQQNHENAFKNFMFKRGQKHLLKDIRRKDYKKNKEISKDLLQSNTAYCHLALSQSKESALRRQAHNKELFRLDAPQLKKTASLLQVTAAKLAAIRQQDLNAGSILQIIDLLFTARTLNKNSLCKFIQFSHEAGNYLLKHNLQSVERFTEQTSYALKSGSDQTLAICHSNKEN